MGTPLTGLQIGSTYNGLLKTTDNAVANGTLRLISDGLGNDTALSVSTAGIKSSGTLEVTGVATLTAQPILSSLTASAAVATDASKGLVSVTNTGTGNNVLATSPTLVTPVLGTPASGNLANCTGYVGTSALVTTGALNSGSITSGFGSIDIGAGSLTAGAISGTTGTFSSGLNVSGGPVNGTAGINLETGVASSAYLFRAYNRTTAAYAPVNNHAASWSFSTDGGGTTAATITSTGLNSTVIGATTPAAGSFTTLAASGNITLTGNPGIVSFTGASFGQVSATTGDMYVSAPSGKKSILQVAGTNIAEASSTGLSVTGTVSTTVRFQSTTSAGSTAWGSTGAELMANTVYGAIVAGYGTTADASLVNRAGNPALEVVANTQNVICRGTLTSTGIISTGSGNSTNGQIKINYAASGSQYGLSICDSANGSGTLFSAFQKSDGTTIGSITRVTTTDAVAFNTTSDARRKENVRDLTADDSGRIIDGLRPRWFDWKNSNENGKGIMGFLAQEAAAVDQSIVRSGAVTKGDDDPDTITAQWAMDASKFMPLAIAEIKSLRARVAALEAI